MRKLAGTIAALKTADKAAKIAAIPANSVIAGAKSQLRQKYGIGAYFRPRMWFLTLLKLSFSQPMLMGIIIVVAVFGFWLYFFGWISLWYQLFYTKAILCVIVNTTLTILNAIYFAIHGVTELMLAGFLDIINGIAKYFLVPIANVINEIAVFTTLADPDTNILTLNPIGENVTLMPQPTQGFAYYVPTSVVGVPGVSAFGFIAVHPGVPIYETDTDGKVIYDEVFDQRGAKLRFPRLNPEADADGGWWVKIASRSLDKKYIDTEIPQILIGSLGTYDATFVDWLRQTIGAAISNWWSNLWSPSEKKLASPMVYTETWTYWGDQVEDEIGFWDYRWQQISHLAPKYWGGFWEYVFEETFWDHRNTIAITYGGVSSWDKLDERAARPVIKDWMPDNKVLWHPSYWGDRW